MDNNEFDNEAARLLDELDECMGYAYQVCEQIKEYIDIFRCGDKEQFIDDVSHCCDYYNLTDDLRYFIK